MPIEPTLIVHDRETAEAVLKNTRKTRAEENVDDVVFRGPVLIGMESAPWKKRRRLVNKCFHANGYLDAINNQCKTMVTHIKVTIQ